MEQVREAENGYFATRILIRVISVVSSEAWADLIRLRSAAKLLRNDSGSNALSHLGQASAIGLRGARGINYRLVLTMPTHKTDKPDVCEVNHVFFLCPRHFTPSLSVDPVRVSVLINILSSAVMKWKQVR
jgi:hypothetical protein